MYRPGRKLRIQKLIDESEQQVASCRKMLEQSAARAELTWKLLAQCVDLVRARSAANPL